MSLNIAITSVEGYRAVCDQIDALDAVYTDTMNRAKAENDPRVSALRYQMAAMLAENIAKVAALISVHVESAWIDTAAAAWSDANEGRIVTRKVDRAAKFSAKLPIVTDMGTLITGIVAPDYQIGLPYPDGTYGGLSSCCQNVSNWRGVGEYAPFGPPSATGGDPYYALGYRAARRCACGECGAWVIAHEYTPHYTPVAAAQ